MIYHVATEMNAEGHRRLIGNDVALVFFLDADVSAFDASYLTDLGAVPQIYLFVQPVYNGPHSLLFDFT